MKAFIARHRYLLLSLAIAAAFSALHWWSDGQPVQEGDTFILPRVVHLLEGRAVDTKFRLRGPLAPHPDVVVAVIDEKSVQKYGRWPWSRSLIARAILQMHRAGAAAVGMDLIFTDEHQDDSALAWQGALSGLDQALAGRPELAAELADYRAGLERRARSSPDLELAAAVAQAPELVLGVVAYPAAEREQFRRMEAEQARVLEPYLLRRLPSENGLSAYEVPFGKLDSWLNYSAQTPLPVFARAARHLGHFNAPPDPDGSLRRLPLFAKLEGPGGLLPGLALQTAAVYLGASIEPDYDPDYGRLVGARLRRPGQPTLRVPMEWSEPFTLVDHVGPGERFPRLSLSDVLDGSFAPEALRGKAVLMGIDLVALFDQRVTPFRGVEAGVYSHASLLSNILEGRYLRRPVELRLLEVLFMLASSLALAVLLPRARFLWKLVGILALLGGWLLLDQSLFTHSRLQLATVLPVSNLLLSSFSVLFLSYLSSDREKGRLRGAFQYYLNESVMEQMLQHPERLKLGGEKKEMTVLFSDIRGFTSLSERMSPEELVKFINSYLTPMTQIVFREGGTLDKYIGDALMAFWGAPIDQPDHALRACRAAAQFVEKLDQLKEGWRAQGLPSLDIGVGINSGPMVVGNMGSDVRFDYTVMGDAVNLASRLEGTNKTYETRVLMSEATWLQVRGQVRARRLGAVRVKGKQAPVRIYELRGLGEARGAEALAIDAFEAALDAYTGRRFEEAEARFQQVLVHWPDDPPTRRYLDEIATFKVRPPEPTWDGVYTATAK